MRYSICKVFQCFSLVASCLVIVGCGGGGGSVAGGGIGGTGIVASGTITAFGSIFVNGIEFETKGANRNVDGEISVSDGSDDNAVLDIGMVVTVVGTLNDDGVTATAASIQYDDAVQGAVQGLSVAADQLTRSFTVMGISVTVHRINTVFDNVIFDTLQDDDLVEVSGFFDAGGVLLATRIERKTGGEVEVKGTVSGLAGATFTLDINNGTTTYMVDATDAELPEGGLSDTLFVEVKGTLSGNTITATHVEQKDEGYDDVEKASIEGVVTDFNGIGGFRVAGQQVDASDASFDPASLQGSIGNGTEVEVEGPILGGVLMADEVEARGGDVELGDRVLSVNPDAGGVTGSLTLQYVPGNLTVTVDSRTTLRDDTGVNDPLTLSDIHASEFLEIAAYRDGASGELIATEIRRIETGDDLLAGPVDSCTAGSLTILGLSFALVDGTTQYQDEEEQPLATSTTFCAAQAAGDFPVKVEDKLPAPDGTADTAELEE
jgi:hypothetical protein